MQMSWGCADLGELKESGEGPMVEQLAQGLVDPDRDLRFSFKCISKPLEDFKQEKDMT